MNMNKRRRNIKQAICAMPRAHNSKYCIHCQCEFKDCNKPVGKATKRWCNTHAVSFGKADYCTEDRTHSFLPDMSPEVRSILRANYLLQYLEPDDSVAWDALCNDFNEVVAGSPMKADGIAVCVMGHAIKWPPAIRFYHGLLKRKSRPLKPEDVVEAFRESVKWADDKPLENMHKGLSVAKRSHATSGIVMAALQLGVLEQAEDAISENAEVLHLGVKKTQYILVPRSECVAFDALMTSYFTHAADAELKWPCQGDKFESFAAKVFELMVTFHSQTIEEKGLRGGKGILRRLTVIGKQKENQAKVVTSKKESDYIVKHCTRHFLIAADRLNLFDDSTTLGDAMKYLPDETGQVEASLKPWTLGAIREVMGVDPIFFSCNLCFAQTFKPAELQKILELTYAEMYEALGKWEREKEKAKFDREDSFPPNFHTLVKTAIADK